MIPAAPEQRIHATNGASVDPHGTHVVYWMIAQRRTRFNFGLQHALHLAESLGLPLVVLEALRVDYPWASDRHHRFILDGMADNAERLQAAGIAAHTYVEPEPGAGRGLLAALSEGAAAVVTDHWPCFFLPRMVEAAAAKLPVAVLAVDSNGVLPLRAAGRDFTTAASFRRHLQKVLAPHLQCFPLADPLDEVRLPSGEALAVLERVREDWPAAAPGLLDGSDPGALAALPIDHGVPCVELRGGSEAAEARLSAFLAGRFERYAEGRNAVEDEPTSGLSPYLHYGHVSSHEVVAAVFEGEDWDLDRLAPKATGSRQGWWGLSPAAEAFLDQVITWRELGFVFTDRNPGIYDEYRTLPDWARETLRVHASDERPWEYSLQELEEARTHDDIWNAAQRQLRREGRIHNYLRMFWGKKVLEWTESPQVALEFLTELNNRWAIDGRDPNSTSGITWIFGRFDRAWGPERPIFGKVRFMSSDSTRRKLKLRRYLEDYGPPAGS